MSYIDNKVTAIRCPGVVDSSEYTLDRLFRVSTYKEWAVYSTLNKIVRDYFQFLLCFVFYYLTPREYSNYWLHLLFCFLYLFFVFVNKQQWVFKMYFIDRNIVAFCLMMYVSSVVRSICSATTGYCKSNLDTYYQRTNVLFLIFWLYCSSECWEKNFKMFYLDLWIGGCTL